MVLILAKAARCSWATTRELLLMFAAKRSMSPSDLDAAYASFERLSPETARRIVNFREERARLRAQTNPQG